MQHNKTLSLLGPFKWLIYPFIFKSVHCVFDMFWYILNVLLKVSFYIVYCEWILIALFLKSPKVVCLTMGITMIPLEQ